MNMHIWHVSYLQLCYTIFHLQVSLFFSHWQNEFLSPKNFEQVPLLFIFVVIEV